MATLSRHITLPYSRRFLLFSQGAAVLLFGMFYYIFLRESGAIYGIETSTLIESSMLPQGETLLLSLPSFLHVVAFILMTYAITGPGKFALLATSGGWYVVETLFELAQQRLYARWIIDHVPDSFQSVPLLENLRLHFLFSTFDPVDLAGIGLGTVVAWFWIRRHYPSEDMKS